MSYTQRSPFQQPSTSNQSTPKLLSGAPPLVLEADAYMRNLLVSLLREAGASVVLTAYNVEAALVSMRQQAPAIILADWSHGAKPEENRISFIRQIRSTRDAPYRSAPIILLSPPRAASEIEQARDAGATEFLIKPIAPKTLADRLRSLETNQRQFVESERFSGPDRRRRPSANNTNFKRSSDVDAGHSSAMQAARAASLALQRDTLSTGDPLAIRIGKSLQKFIAHINEYTSVEEEVVQMHRSALAQLAQMIDEDDLLRTPVVHGLESVVAKRMGHI